MLNKGAFTCVKVIGVGEGGIDTINWLSEFGMKGVEFVAMNTDRQSLYSSHAKVKVQIGKQIKHSPDSGIGSKIEEKDEVKIEAVLHRADVVFVVAGMGGGTGTVAAPAVAQMAKRLGALTIGIATKPFTFEGRKKSAKARSGIMALDEAVDTLIVLSNDKFVEIDDHNLWVLEVLQEMNDSLERKGARHLEMDYCVGS